MKELDLDKVKGAGRVAS